MSWSPIDLSAPLYLNLRPDELSGQAASVENILIDENRGHITWPGLVTYATLGDPGRVFLYNYQQTLVAVTSSGRCYEVAGRNKVVDKTEAPIGVAERPTFSTAQGALLVAGGADIIRVLDKTAVLSPDAPKSAWIAFVQGYGLALERDTGLIRHTDPEDLTSWPAINFFDAESKPDEIIGLLVTRFNDIMIPGLDSTEFFRISADPVAPFVRRSDAGEGVLLPYTLCEAGGSVWGFNAKREFVQLELGGAQVASGQEGLAFEELDDLTLAWAAACEVRGQKTLALAFPRATNAYGKRGVFLIYDYKAHRWSQLFGPGGTRYPVWSFATTRDGVFAGGEGGVVYRLETATGASDVARSFRYRSSPISATTLAKGADEVFVNNMRLRLSRPNANLGGRATALITIRTRWEDGRWSFPLSQPLEGRREAWVEFGAQGQGSAFEWEYTVHGAEGLDWGVTRAEVDVERTGF